MTVNANSRPYFEPKPESRIGINFNETYVYKLPEAKDREGNELDVYVEKSMRAEEEYPEFLIFDNQTRTITFEPNKPE